MLGEESVLPLEHQRWIPPRPTGRVRGTSLITSAEASATGRVPGTSLITSAETYATKLERLRPILANPQPGVPRPQNRLRPIGDLKLGEDRGQVVGNSLR
jgi:hypothetical protein